jgi:hypothetical protein
MLKIYIKLNLDIFMRYIINIYIYIISKIKSHSIVIP